MKSEFVGRSPSLVAKNGKPRGRYVLRPAILDRIWLERLRQMQLLKEGRIHHDCASPEVSWDRKLRTLLEKLGESAQAVDALDGPHNPDSTEHLWKLLRKKKEHLRDELTQLAAVSIACLEGLEDMLKEGQ